MTRAEAQAFVAAVTTWEADYDLQGATLKQLAQEIDIVVAAIQHGANDSMVTSTLLAIAQRANAVAEVAQSVERALAPNSGAAS